MRGRHIALVVCAVTAAFSSAANGQAPVCINTGGVRAEARAFTSEIFGSRAGDTTANGVDPGEDFAVQTEAGVAASFMDSVGTAENGSEISGTANDCASRTDALASGSQVSAAPAFEAVSADSTAVVTCNECCVGTGRTDLLVVGGEPVPIPGEQPPNTELLPGIVANRQVCARNFNDFSGEFTVDSFFAPDLGIVLSESFGKLTNLPRNCAFFLVGLDLAKTGGILAKPQGADAEIGDRVAYTIVATNDSEVSGSGCAGEGQGPVVTQQLMVFDRIPEELDDGDVTVSVVTPGGAGGFLIDDCPADVSFTTLGVLGGLDLCQNDSEAGDRCVIVNAGDLEPGSSATIKIEAPVRGVGGRVPNICNAVVAGNRGAEFTIPGADGGPTPTPTGGGGVSGDALKTFGGGGCAAVPGGRPALDGAAIAAVALGLALRRRRRSLKNPR